MKLAMTPPQRDLSIGQIDFIADQHLGDILRNSNLICLTSFVYFKGLTLVDGVCGTIPMAPL